jgi:hypothetical protein
VKSRKITEEEIELAARNILKNDKFLQCQNTGDRIRLARELAKEAGVSDYAACYHISERAERLYMAEVHPIREKELKEKVQELKAKGMKKIEIRSKLAIGEAALNRHWY